MKVLIHLLCLVGLAVGAQARADTCSDLLGKAPLLTLPDTVLTSAATVSTGSFVAPDGSGTQVNLPSFCRVTATLKPSSASDVKVEVWLPTANWNQRLQGVGGGGLAGVISYSALAPAIRSGYVSVSTDTGHVSSDTTWLSSIEKEKDYGGRAIHGMTVTAKAVIEQFYQAPLSKSYFNGCSTGGGQAFGELQEAPDDYDGILAGAPQNFPTRLRAAEIYEYQAGSNDPKSLLPADKLTLLTKTVLAQCGAADAVADGFLANPQTCTFNPKVLTCRPGQDAATCLTPNQVLAAYQIYRGPVNPRTGFQVWPGLSPGSEGPAGLPGWTSAGISGPPFSTASPFYRLGVFENPAFDLRRMTMDGDVQAADFKFPFINHINTNLDPFTQHAGKLIFYHGWADPLIAPQNTINFLGSVVAGVNTRAFGGANFDAAYQTVSQSARLFLVPGMGHCSGGPGPDQFDGLGALVKWVENGQAPDSMVASHVTGGNTTYTRPLCPYPQVATYAGVGDRTAAANWTCMPSPAVYDFGFYTRGYNIY
jgi:feruloyl esterase